MSKLTEFINNVVCRRDSNQHKAHKLWEDSIKKTLNDKERHLFRVEWNHYEMGEIDINHFKHYISIYLK